MWFAKLFYTWLMMTSLNGNISALLATCAGNSPVTGEFPAHKGQWRGALMFSLICAWINDWVNNREAGDLRRHRTHCDVIVMYLDEMVMTELRFVQLCWIKKGSHIIIWWNNYRSAYLTLKMTPTSHAIWSLRWWMYAFPISFSGHKRGILW